MGRELTSGPGAMIIGEQSQASPADHHFDWQGFLVVSTAAAAVGLFARNHGGRVACLVGTTDAKPI
jgi:hypothetical protein